MTRKLFDTILWVGYAVGLEEYDMSLQRNGLAGAPTTDEARKDYRAYVRFNNKI